MPDAALLGAPALLGLLAAGLGVGVASALTPFLPAEAYVLAVAATQQRGSAIAVAVAVGVGQTVGKIVIFSAVRGAGRSRWLGRLRGRSGVGAARDAGGAGALAAADDRAGAADPGRPSPRRWRARARVRAWLGRARDVGLAALSGRGGWAVVLLSAVVGIPPLLAVAFVAGASTMRRRTFVPAVLVGRSARFVVIAALPEVFRSLLGA